MNHIRRILTETYNQKLFDFVKSQVTRAYIKPTRLHDAKGMLILHFDKNRKYYFPVERLSHGLMNDIRGLKPKTFYQKYANEMNLERIRKKERFSLNEAAFFDLYFCVMLETKDGDIEIDVMAKSINDIEMKPHGTTAEYSLEPVFLSLQKKGELADFLMDLVMEFTPIGFDHDEMEDYSDF